MPLTPAPPIITILIDTILILMVMARKKPLIIPTSENLIPSLSVLFTGTKIMKMIRRRFKFKEEDCAI